MNLKKSDRGYTCNWRSIHTQIRNIFLSNMRKFTKGKGINKVT